MRPRLNVHIDPSIAKNDALRALSRKPRLAEFNEQHKAEFKERSTAWKEQQRQKKKPRGIGRRFQPGVSGNPSGRPKNGNSPKPSKRRSLFEARRQIIAQSGLTPLEFLLSVVRDPECHMDYRIDAAKAASPYVHRKMPIAIEGGDPTKPIVFEASVLAVLAPSEKMMLLALMEKMAGALQAKTPQALIESVAVREAESDDADSKSTEENT